jgi:hypothetical protein
VGGGLAAGSRGAIESRAKTAEWDRKVADRRIRSCGREWLESVKTCSFPRHVAVMLPLYLLPLLLVAASSRRHHERV